MSGKTAVPQPPIKPVIGNLADVDPRNSIDSLMKLAKTYGPFFKMRIFSDEFYVASSQELVNELSDESLFEKKLSAELLELRYLGGDGLFTAHTHEPNWGKAHRILMPALGPLGVARCSIRCWIFQSRCFCVGSVLAPMSILMLLII
ncbi:cytochrome P450 [Pectobacterium aroidearum]|uniref:cytochrome P450 n=1 Tax=Pectobacterium aroidearum TaxID=1201031 RepID=UPI001C69B8CD|nr:cytochrome P450 [Pectobacterium aroidearum]UXK00684.1 cytochrome P450 [Pectobacterium aroidearum]